MTQTARTLTDRVIFITGVSSGLGRSLAAHLLDRGAHVAGTVRRADQVAAFEALAPGRALGVVLDVTDPAAVERGVSAVVERFGRIDVLVNNAGFGMVGAVEETSDEEARRIFETNFFGNHRMTRAVLPTMRAQGSGHVLFASAVGGFTGFPGLGVYSAAKGATDILAEALRGEVAPLGIDVTVLTLGIFRTDFAGRSLAHTARELEAYAETPAGKFRGFIGNLSGKQPNDPERAAAAIATLLEADEPPMHLALGPDALGVMRKKLGELENDLNAWETVSASTAFPKDGDRGLARSSEADANEAARV
ncbi:MAG: oxidoreductase [Myxococcota bacterium]